VKRSYLAFSALALIVAMLIAGLRRRLFVEHTSTGEDNGTD
jgi:hypothetical protein